MLRRLIRQAGTFTVLSWGWKHRGSVLRGVDLARRAPALVQDGRTDDLLTEARAVAALDGPFGDETSVRITGIENGSVMLRDSVIGPELDAARGTLCQVRDILDVRTEGIEHPTLDEALAGAGR
jgi:hypothetical protein